MKIKKSIFTMLQKMQKKTNFFRKKNKKGFSFVEVLVSVFLITTGVMAAITLFAKEFATLTSSRSQVIAGLLAQEGSEMVRNVRDTNWLQGQKAFAADFPSTSSTECAIDFSNTQLRCGGAVEKRLFYTPAFSGSEAYVYLHTRGSGGKETKFKRKITIDYDTNLAETAEEAKVISLVTWAENFDEIENLSDCNSRNKCAYAESILTIWDNAD
jgi:hypothetical protein